MKFNQVVVNLTADKKLIRHETLEGQPYMVVPMVMLTEGVHNGSGGRLYYPESELEKTPDVWNTKPVVIFHPKKDGQPVSACTPDVLETRKAGLIMNTRYDSAAKKLRAEAWLQESRLQKIDDRVLTALEAGTVMEVSTGLFSDRDETPGTYGDQEYDAIARNLRPDHLAILPEGVGACSVAAGAGLLQVNELSFDSIREQIATALRIKFPLREEAPRNYTWVVDVFPDFFVYEHDNNLFRLSYSISNDVVSLSGEPEQVVRVAEYRTVTGAFVGNCKFEPKEKANMDKKQLIDGLIANETLQWGADDRAFLETLTEDQLKKMTPAKVATTPAAPVANGETTPPAATVPANAPVANGNVVPPAKPRTLTEYMNDPTVPAEVRAVLQNNIQREQREREDMISRIVANERNQYTPEFLRGKDTAELEVLARMLAPVQDLAAPIANYAGAATPMTITRASAVPEPLPLPKMEFGTK